MQVAPLVPPWQVPVVAEPDGMQTAVRPQANRSVTEQAPPLATYAVHVDVAELQ